MSIRPRLRIKTGNNADKGNAKDRDFCFLAFSKEGTDTNAALVSGMVNADGTIEGGTNYRVTRIGTGLYLVTFNTPFSTFPVAVATQNYPQWDDFNSNGGNTKKNVVIVAAEEHQVLFKTGNNDGDARDRNFLFLAYDPGATGETRAVVSGDVDGDGDIHSGDGFQSVHDDQGEYTIVYDTGTFASTPVVVTTQNYPKWTDFTSNGGDTFDNATVIAVNKDKCKLKTGRADGEARDRNFCFVAVQPL